MRRGALLIATALCLLGAALLPAGASAAPAPAWTLSLTPLPANFAPGANAEYLVLATNVGAAPTTSEETELQVSVPPGLAILEASLESKDPNSSAKPICTPAAQLITCKTEEPLGSGQSLQGKVLVKVNAAEGVYDAKATIGGGGAAQEASATTPTHVQAALAPFDFLPGFNAPATNEDGSSAALAGSHPYQQTIAFAFPTANLGDKTTNNGHPHDVSVELPRGLVGNPAASKVLCSEAELTGKGCPLESQVGILDVTTLVGETGTNGISTTPLYNMVPPPGSPAEFATNVADAGLYLHVIANVRSEGDYGVEAQTRDAIAFGQQPIFGVQAQIWGDPSAKAHDAIRGECAKIAKATCPVKERKIPFLTMPGDCPKAPLPFEVRADSWEEISPPAAEKTATYESADLSGGPVTIEGCGDLPFSPTIGSQPTTDLTDSPAGLRFDLHQPQEDVDSRAPATLKDTVIRFPAGLTVNASQAGGLGACTEAQMGFKDIQGGQPHFFKASQSCPAAAKLGTVEATSPLLVARNEAHEVLEEEGKPVPEALHGSIYIAKPFANPFGSLIAIYFVVEDPKTGVVVKLAGEGQLDPQSGQITTSVKEAPELPIEDIEVRLFGGSHGAFVTPPTCGEFTTETDLTPWSSPEGKDAFPGASFQTTRAPGGGTCPTSEAQMPNAYGFSAGTESPAAGKYSPLIFKLSREDGTQRLGRFEATLPTGLSAKLAGVAQCSEADITKAKSREAPEQGRLEQADPSCPAGSEIGVVNGAAGAGPTPYYTSGHAYLAGPYKGAPLSAVTIVPAVAGPFDLGAVVARVALYLDPTTAQVRAVSDPLPTILHGVPIDLRSVALRAQRPNFTLNPTSCEEKSFAATATSSLGSPAPLFQRFQVGGCKSLPYKPKMSVRLFGPTHRGAHPRLKAVFTAKPGEANTAKVSFTLPRSEFIDQAHFRTICTRVQFAANQCPAGSVYGHVKAITPILGYPLEGPAYLRSSNHKLPDLVVALHGPAYQPIEIDAVGRVDSVNGGLRVRFEEVPDAPLSKLIFTAQGAKKGLFQNSTNICKGTHRATLKLDAQSGKVYDTQPLLRAQCPKGAKGKGGGGAKHKR